MDGKNSSGRRISLLNDSSDPPPHPQPVRLHSFSPSLPSRTSSYASSPIGSPPTPQLVRSDSSDSTTMQTPSPITPEFGFDGIPNQSMASPVFPQSSFFPSQKDLHSAYPPISQGSGPLPYHAQAAPQGAYFRPQQPTESRSTSASANPRSKKNSYPCPMAKQFNCNDYFTTSGHAARHAKKHTGKKDAFCPECNKAFTRKDNMEQHRRTHQSGRNASKGVDSSVKKAKVQAKRPKPAPIQSSMSSLSSLSMVDPSLPVSPSSSYMAPAVQPVDAYSEYSQRSPYPDPTAYSMAHSYSVGSSYGLDALAIAASGEKRKYES
ncbi:hypothetical protein BS50DRAFT_223575 [Corynespora cassiicola Philippines]|uniref:C2H2 type master regulator of conidiophore development brlA n=1 Tax=Corynespora cassiicola Philippines TaxID=1448308 RepID=A0A2T2N2U4_CORCC|nr:hypothetical protein BS50DRAFT_223575 [Corynespora cassiicola Philippines]